MTSSTHAPNPAEGSAVNSVLSSRLGYGVAVLLGATCAIAISPTSALAEPIASESSLVHEIPTDEAQIPSAADLMLEAPIENQATSTQTLNQQLLNEQLSDESVAVYPVVVDPALAAVLSNGEVAEGAELPLLLTQIEENTTESRPEFGAKGQTRWFLQAAAATEGDGESFGLFGGGMSYFFAEGHSVELALNGMAFDLPDKDPVGVNLDLLVRSHWIRGENWSLYIDGGAGILVSTSRVPNSGSSFNFTPQGGVGASFNVNKEKDQRLYLGVRWHHISNANTFESNPGLDTYMGYVGMTFPIN